MGNEGYHESLAIVSGACCVSPLTRIVNWLSIVSSLRQHHRVALNIILAPSIYPPKHSPSYAGPAKASALPRPAIPAPGLFYPRPPPSSPTLLLQLPIPCTPCSPHPSARKLQRHDELSPRAHHHRRPSTLFHDVVSPQQTQNPLNPRRPRLPPSK